MLHLICRLPWCYYDFKYVFPQNLLRTHTHTHTHTHTEQWKKFSPPSPPSTQKKWKTKTKTEKLQHKAAERRRKSGELLSHPTTTPTHSTPSTVPGATPCYYAGLGLMCLQPWSVKWRFSLQLNVAPSIRKLLVPVHCRKWGVGVF